MNKSQIITEVVPRDTRLIESQTGNLYEGLMIIAKRANQLSVLQKEELQEKLSEFAPSNDSLDEVFENREQIEISTRYEKMPKTTLAATDEFIDGQIYFRAPNTETE